MDSVSKLPTVLAHIRTMTVTQLLTVGQDPDTTATFLALVDQARPGKYKAYNAYSPQEFAKLAKAHKQEVVTVVLGAAQTDEQVEAAKAVIGQVWEDGKVHILRIPASLLTPEGKKGDSMMRWFLEPMEGANEGECGCC